MSERVPCKECGATILPSTAAATGGVCMACKQGIRQNIERSKKFYEEQRKPNPERDYWSTLINRIYKTPEGYEGLSEVERVYYLACVVNGEVHNGGLHQFYSNSSGDRYTETLSALEELDAWHSRRILARSCELLFPGMSEPPQDRDERFDVLPWWPKEPSDPPATWAGELDRLDKEFWADPDGLSERLTAWGVSKGLFIPKTTD